MLQTKLAVGLVSALVQHANFERRQGQMEAAKALYEAFITQVGTAECHLRNEAVLWPCRALLQK